MTNMSCQMISKRVIIGFFFNLLYLAVIVINCFFSLQSVIILLYHIVYLFIFALFGSSPGFFLHVHVIILWVLWWPARKPNDSLGHYTQTFILIV